MSGLAILEYQSATIPRKINRQVITQYCTMPSSLLSEKAIVISPSLAATIGLEESILLQVLHETVLLRQTAANWYELSNTQLERLLPFWNDLDLQRIAKSLVDKGIILLDSAPYQQSRLLRFTLNEHDTQHPDNQAAGARKSRQHEQTAPARSRGANFIPPHWQPDTQVLASLSQHHIPTEFIFGQLGEFITYWRERQEISHSWGAKFIKHVLRAWRHHQSDTRFTRSSSQTPTQLDKDWYPSEDALEILERNGIHRNFIEDAIAEFVLYWQERGDATTTWNSKFIKHVQRQWAKYSSALAYDTEPRRIPDNWQPDADVFDILKMANIDSHFAEGLVQEFTLFWKDSNQLHNSWNTKFLQHVKFHWARQHQMNNATSGSYAGQQKSYTAGGAQAQGFIEKHTDRSWADGL
jgi:hypothetical protein